jgi:hypothetical protein
MQNVIIVEVLYEHKIFLSSTSQWLDAHNTDVRDVILLIAVFWRCGTGIAERSEVVE